MSKPRERLEQYLERQLEAGQAAGNRHEAGTAAGLVEDLRAALSYERRVAFDEGWVEGYKHGRAPLAAAVGGKHLEVRDEQA